MTRRNRTILILSIILIAFIAVTIYSYITAKRAAPNEPVTLKEFFTFGRSPATPADQTATDTSPTQTTQTPPTSNEIPSSLQQISTRAIAGAVAVRAERIVVATPEQQAAEGEPVLEWTRNLKEGDVGEDVRELQVFLNKNIGPAEGTSTIIAESGPGSIGRETTSFGPATKKAVGNFQEKFSIIDLSSDAQNNLGIVDEKTRAKIHELIAALPQKEEALAVRYVDRETGNIYQTFTDSIAEKKISSTTIPRIEEAYFNATGSSVLLRFLADDNTTIATFEGTVPAITESGDSALSLVGSFLTKNILSLSFAPDGQRFFYLTANDQNAIGTITDTSGKIKNQLWSSAYTEWLPQWVNDRIITLTTKPSSIAPGYLYTLDTKTRVFSKILGNINGLTTLTSPNGKEVLYSRTSPDGNAFILALYNTDTKQSSDLGINTLPEKCVWGSDSIVLYCAVPDTINAGQYPDIWYQGVVSFSDSIWKLDTRASLFKKIASPRNDVGVDIDGTNLFTDSTESHLFMTNKRDATLWMTTI